jgi:hypothetical protein
VVAAINALTARRIAIDNAHRTYRKELADASVAATQVLLNQLYELGDIVKTGGDWRVLAREIRATPSRKVDLRKPNDEVFADAITLFVRRRHQVGHWLFEIGAPRPSVQRATDQPF